MTFSNPNTPSLLPKLATNRNFSFDRTNSQPNLAKMVTSSFHKEDNSSLSPMEEDPYDLEYVPSCLEPRDDLSNYSSINSSVNLDDFNTHCATNANVFCAESQNLVKNNCSTLSIGDDTHQVSISSTFYARVIHTKAD